MPSASTWPPATSTRTTSLKPERSTRGRVGALRSRKRFEVPLASPTPPAPRSRSASSRRVRFSSCRFIQERPAHRIVVADVALAHHDLEEVRPAVRRAEHLRAGPEIGAPDAAEFLIEPFRVELVHLFPVAIEPFGPVVERERVVAAQILDIDHFEPAALAPVDRLRKARDPAAGEDVLADPELGVPHAHVPDEVDHPEAARLEIIRVGLEDLPELISPGVLERADREQLVELARHLAEVALEHLDFALEAAALDLRAGLLHLLGSRIDSRPVGAVVFPRVEEEVAPTAADIGEGVAGFQQHLAADVVHLGALRVFQRFRAAVEPGAGIRHADLVEPLPIEVLAGPVVEARVRLRLRDRAVAEAQLVPPVAQGDKESRAAVEPGVHARAKHEREIALDVDVAVEIRLQKSYVAEEKH